MKISSSTASALLELGKQSNIGDLLKKLSGMKLHFGESREYKHKTVPNLDGFFDMFCYLSEHNSVVDVSAVDKSCHGRAFYLHLSDELKPLEAQYLLETGVDTYMILKALYQREKKILMWW